MNLLETILQAQNGGAVSQLANQFGLDQGQTNSALAQLIPALASGMKNNVRQQNGLDSLVSALNAGNHSRYLDDVSQLGQQSTVTDGNAILGHLLGSKQVSREVASRASQNTGIDSGILKKMLPIVATMVMGGMSKQSGAGGLLGSLLGGNQSRQSSGIESMLSSFLDQDGDGSIADDLLSKFLR